MKENSLKFEAYIAGELTNKTSPTYLGLADKIKDLAERTIYQQVQFCLGGSGGCSGKGEYFIADFVFVKKAEIDGEEYLDVVIADTKLNEGTDFTKNQKAGMNLSELKIKSVPTSVKNGGKTLLNPLTGDKVKKFDAETDLPIRRSVLGDFFKIFSGGTIKSFGGIK